MKYSTVSVALLLSSLASVVSGVAFAQPLATAAAVPSVAPPKPSAGTPVAALPSAAPPSAAPPSAAPPSVGANATAPGTGQPGTPASGSPSSAANHTANTGPALAQPTGPAAVNSATVTVAPAAAPSTAAPTAAPQTNPESPWNQPVNPWPAKPRQPAAEEPPPKPIQQWGELHIGVNNILTRDAGYDFFSKDNAWRSINLTLEAEVSDLNSATALGVQLGYAYGVSDNGMAHNQVGFSGSLSSHDPHLAALLKWKPTSWLALHARAHAGYSFSKLKLERAPGGPSQPVSVTQSSPFGGLGAGFSLTSPALRLAKHRSFLNGLSLGGRAEAGYSFAKAIDVSLPDQSANPPAQRLPVRGADLGTLERSGPYLYVGIFARL
jgi:hypothetical protein